MLNFLSYKQIVQTCYDKQALIDCIFFEARTIQLADGCLFIPLVLTKVTIKIEIILKKLSALNVITAFWFTELIQLNLQKQNLNLLMRCTSIRLYLCYLQCKLGNKFKIKPISLLYLPQNKLWPLGIQLLRK